MVPLNQCICIFPHFLRIVMIHLAGQVNCQAVLLHLILHSTPPLCYSYTSGLFYALPAALFSLSCILRFFSFPLPFFRYCARPKGVGSNVFPIRKRICSFLHILIFRVSEPPEPRIAALQSSYVSLLLPLLSVCILSVVVCTACLIRIAFLLVRTLLIGILPAVRLCISAL